MTNSTLPLWLSTIDRYLDVRATADPDGLAFAIDDERITYGELHEQATDLAGGMHALGVHPGDHVVLVLPVGLDFVRVFWAVQILGAVSCALNPASPPETIVRRASRVRPSLVVAGGAGAAGIAEASSRAGIRCATPGEIPRGHAAPPAPLRDPENIAVLQPTSGTSGESRTAMISHRGIGALLHGATDLAGMTPSDVFVSWVPPWHDMGLIRFVAGPVYLGAPCHLVTPAVHTIPAWLAKVSEVRGTVTGAPDFAWKIATKIVNPAGLDLRSMRYGINGGEPVRLTTIRDFEAKFGVPGSIRPGYGLAEATLSISFVHAGEELRVDDRGHVSCGRALAGLEVRIDEGPDGVGEILARGPAIFAGYLDAPAATAEVLRDGWLHTGDIGKMDAGGHIYVLGRIKAMLKRGGAVLAPRELEEVVHDVPGVKIAAAVGVPSSDGTEKVVVAVELAEGVEGRGDEVAAEASRRVQAALGFAPDRVLVLPPRTIPRTWNGKIRHAALRDGLAAGAVSETA